MTIQGLTEAEAITRFSQQGPNELPQDEKKSFGKSVFDIVREPMIILLISAGLINVFLAKAIDAILLTTTIFIIVGISIFQERRTERALSALRDLTAPLATVVRDGVAKRIPSSHVVIGDLLILGEGDRIAADAKLLSCVRLHVDESLLTGESSPNSKSELDHVFAGSLVVKGHARAMVSAIGTATKIGQIGKSISEMPFQRTRLQREVDRLVKFIGALGFVAVALVIIVFGISRNDWLEGALAGIAAAMALIPEEFPVILTLFLAIGAWRMSKVRVIARRSAAIETLGSISALCVDKTGTLTLNQMTVQAFVINGERFILGDISLPDKCREIARISSLAAPINVFDPMDRAFRAISEIFLPPEKLVSLREFPLERERLAYIHIWQDDMAIAAAKGAPEEILRLCSLPESKIKEIEDQVQNAAKNGLRVLAIASATINPSDVIPEDPKKIGFIFLGLALLQDPIRPGVTEAVEECRRAGVRTIMITGDHQETAIAIAREIKLSEPENCLSGTEIAEMSDDHLSQALRKINVFARVAPEHKLRIVRALQRNGDVVAMTGDGVNDAPALRAAEIGIAMGGRGTDVAREAAALIITDDNFTSIVAGIRSGRTIYSNLQKAMTYVVAIHIPIFGTAIAPIFRSDWPLILLPALVAFHEIIIDPACSIVFEEEAPDPAIMERKPIRMGSALLDREGIWIAILQGISVLCGVLSTFFFSLSQGYSEERVRSLTFGTLMISNLLLILINRSRSLSLLSTLARRRNPSVIWISALVAAVIGVLFNVTPVSSAFGLERLSFFDYTGIAIMSFISIAWFDIWKLIKKREEERRLSLSRQ